MALALQLHFEGAAGSAEIFDTSTWPGHAVTSYGAVLSTAQKKFGSASLLLDGSALVESNHATDFSSGTSFTAECFIYPTSAASDGAIFDIYLNASNRVVLQLDADRKLHVRLVVAGTWYEAYTAASIIPLNAWTHVAVVKNGTTIEIYAGGSRRVSLGSGIAGSVSAQYVSVGGGLDFTYSFATYFTGYIDEFRYQPGVVEYNAATYTVPTAEFTDPVAVDFFAASAPTELTVINSSEYVASAPTALTVAQATYVASAPMRLAVTGYYAASAPTALLVVSPGMPTSWTLRCTLDGVDVSGRLTGQQSVRAEEGAARIAEVRLLPPSGTLDVLAYVGVQVRLDFVQRVGAVEVPRRVFTGRVDTPVYDISGRTLVLTCIDDMQNRVAALARADIDAVLTGGRYAEAVQGTFTDNWDYAQAVMTTLPGSLDCDATGGLRLTLWDGSALHATYTDSELIYPRSEITFPQRTSIVNSVSIDYQYRYPRLRQRYTSVGFTATRIDMDAAGYVYPSQSEIESAVLGSGWVMTLGVFYPAPVTIPHLTGGVVRTRDGSIDMAVMWLTQRHGQSVSERYAITVRAPESIAQNGTLPHGLTGALEDGFDYKVWEADYSMAPLMPTGGEQDWAPTAGRAASDHAIQTLLAQARTKILGSHRGATVTNATPCDPSIDLDKTLRILTADIDASGKVRSVRHVFDMAAGSAITEFSLALFGAGGAGIITPDSLDPPPAPDPVTETQDWGAGVPSLLVNVYGVTPYSDSLMGLLLNPEQYYTVEDVPDGLGGFSTISYTNPHYTAGSYPQTGFRVSMPGVDDADRTPTAIDIAQNYNVVLPANSLTISIP